MFCSSFCKSKESTNSGDAVVVEAFVDGIFSSAEVGHDDESALHRLPMSAPFL